MGKADRTHASLAPGKPAAPQRCIEKCKSKLAHALRIARNPWRWRPVVAVSLFEPILPKTKPAISRESDLGLETRIAPVLAFVSIKFMSWPKHPLVARLIRA
jgi:hypothetical protein